VIAKDETFKPANFTSISLGSLGYINLKITPESGLSKENIEYTYTDQKPLALNLATINPFGNIVMVSKDSVYTYATYNLSYNPLTDSIATVFSCRTWG
jgi:hypothetical protein